VCITWKELTYEIENYLKYMAYSTPPNLNRSMPIPVKQNTNITIKNRKKLKINNNKKLKNNRKHKGYAVRCLP
jgi:hypothetical protein